jgi:hypothetical protein
MPSYFILFFGGRSGGGGGGVFIWIEWFVQPFEGDDYFEIE